MSRQSWQRIEPSLLKESAIGVPHAAQSCVVRALEPLPESPETEDVVRIRIIPPISTSLPRAGEAALTGR
jgi:hypothetical protein